MRVGFSSVHLKTLEEVELMMRGGYQKRLKTIMADLVEKNQHQSCQFGGRKST